ncbi:MAG: DUF6265 family protein [Fimbriimonadaceae bacterium]
MSIDETRLSEANSLTTKFQWIVGDWFGTNDHTQSQLVWESSFNNVMHGMYSMNESGTFVSSGKLQLTEENGVIKLYDFTFDSKMNPIAGLTEPAIYTLSELMENYAKFTSDLSDPFRVIEMVRIGDAMTCRYEDKDGELGDASKIEYIKVGSI